MEEKEFQLMLDIANEKMELTENRFRSISDTMKRVRDSGKLDDYDKTQVSLLCNKFSLAIEKLNGKTEYEVAMEEMSGGMMALIAAAIGAILAMLAKMFGFFGSPKEGTAPTKANIEALKTTSKSVVDTINNISKNIINLNNQFKKLSVYSKTLSTDVATKIGRIKDSGNLLCICKNMPEYGKWEYPDFTIVRKAETDGELNKVRGEIGETFNKIIKEIIEPSEKIFDGASKCLASNNGAELTELMKAAPQDSVDENTFSAKTTELKVLIDKRKGEKFDVSEINLWESITTNVSYMDGINYEDVGLFINFLDKSELRKEKLIILQKELKKGGSISGVDELRTYITFFNKCQTSYLIHSSANLDGVNASFKNLKLHIELIRKIIDGISEIKTELLKNNTSEVREMETTVTSTMLMINSIIDKFIELSEHVPHFKVNKTSVFFTICGDISKIKKFSVTK